MAKLAPSMVLLVAALVLTGCGESAKTKTVTVHDAPTTVDKPHTTPEAPKTMTSREVVAALAKAGLEAERPVGIADADYGVAPHTTEDGTQFFTPSVCADDCSGRVWVYSDAAKLKGAKAAYDALGAKGDPFFSWTFVNPRLHVLLQLNGEMAETKAKRYGEAISALA